MDKDIELLRIILKNYNKEIYISFDGCKERIIPLEQIVLNNCPGEFKKDIIQCIKNIKGTSNEINIYYEIKEKFFDRYRTISIGQIIMTYYCSIYDWIKNNSADKVCYFITYLNYLIRVFNFIPNQFKFLYKFNIPDLSLFSKIILLRNKDNLKYNSNFSQENFDEYILQDVFNFNKESMDSRDMNEFLNLAGRENYKKYILRESTYKILNKSVRKEIRRSLYLNIFSNQEIEDIIVNLMNNSIFHKGFYLKLKEINSKYADEYISLMLMEELKN
jgi:hypothetical protein